MLAKEYEVMAELESLHWWYRSLRRRLLLMLAQEASLQRRSLNVFDAGCGTGGLLAVLRQRPDVRRAEGCDLHPQALSHARSKGLTVMQRSVNNLHGITGGWDIVFCIDVLYHQDVCPSEAISGMAALLAPGGLLLLNVAAMPCLRREHDRNVMGARRFLPGELQHLVQASGLHVIDISYWNSWLTPLLWLRIRWDQISRTQRHSGLQLPAPWLNRSLELLLDLERRVAPRFALPWGSSLLLSARKPHASEGRPS
jgi:SAM-dependent methyltransferase